MSFVDKKKFDFVSGALPADTFGVVRFKGYEGFSTNYRFVVDLVSQESEIDLTKVLQNPATFTIVRENGDIPFHGILAQFEQLHEVDAYVFYRAVLVPRLWWLSLSHHNQVILDKSVPDFIEAVLKDGGLTNKDFTFERQNEYPQWEYLCQYRESHFNFVSRWMEREGIYYYFEQGDDAEKVIITDTRIAHAEMPQGKTMYYSPPSGMAELHREEVITAFMCRQKMLPKTLRLKDYNYRKPSMEITGEADVLANGRGEVYLYGEHFRTRVEGDALAKIRAEELLCREKEFHGESTIPYLRPGYCFDLEDHYRSGFNRKYLTIELTHEGSQAAYLMSGIQKGLAEVEEDAYYRNTFMAIPAEVQFRPERKTEKPRFYGTMNAKIDAAGTGRYAELDEQGRYKVLMPLDVSGRKDGKASAYFRMAQPYAGTDHGMHFPLHKATEVLLTFIDGDPDRPIIQGAIPNPETPSVVTAVNQDHSNIKTSSGNEIDFKDENGHERILLQSPCKDSLLKLGDTYEMKESTAAKGFGVLSALISYKQTAIKLGLGLAGLIMPSSELSGSVDKGVQLNTSGGLKIGAVNKEESIGLGYSSTSVKGAKFSSVTGYSARSVTGYSDESVMGKRSQLIVGSNDESIMGFKEYLVTKKDEVVGKATKVKGVATKLVGKITKLFGQKTKVGEEEIEMQEMTTTMSGEKTELDGEKTALSGEKTELDGEKTALSGEKTELSGEKTEISGGKTELSGEKTALSGEKTELSGEETILSSEKTELTGETNQISGLVNIM